MEDARFGVTLDFEKFERFVETIKLPFRKALNTGRIELKRPAEGGKHAADDIMARATKSAKAVFYEDKLVVPLHSGGRVLALLYITGVKASQLKSEVHPFLSALADNALDMVRLRLALETDQLTGLANEYALDEALTTAISRFTVAGHRMLAQSADAGQDDLALLYLQPHGMPTMLERYGRLYTHNFLKDIAKRLKETAGPCLVLSREDNKFMLLLASNRESVKDLAKNISEAIASYSPKRKAAAIKISWHMGAAMARMGLNGLPPVEEAALLRMRSARSLDKAVRLNWSGVLMFDEIIAKAGRVNEVLSFNRLMLDVGALHGLKENARFAVVSNEEDKAEIQVVSLGEEDALAEVVNLAQPTVVIKAGDCLRLLTEEGDSSPLQENTIALSGREFMVSADESSGLIAHQSLMGIFNQLAEEEQDKMAVALIRVYGLGNMRQVVGRLGANRLFKTLAERALSYSDACGNIAIGRYAPDTMAVLLPGFSESRAFNWISGLMEHLQPYSENPLRAGIGYFPCADFSALETMANAAKALNHAAFLEPGSIVPCDAVSLNISGDSLFDQGRLAEAAAEYERALLLCDHEVNVLNSLGVCYAQLGDMDKAFAMFAKAEAVAPDDYMAYYNQGYTLLGQKKWEEAKAKFAHCLELKPGHADTLFQLGRVAQERGELALALEYYRDTAASPECPGGVYRYLGEVLALSGNRLEAEDAFKKAIKYNSSDAISLGQLSGMYLSRNANLEIALSLSKRALDLHPALPRHWHVYGQALISVGRLQNAIAVLQQGLTQFPAETALLMEMAGLQIKLGLNEAARENLNLVLKHEPNLEEALNILAAIEEQ